MLLGLKSKPMKHFAKYYTYTFVKCNIFCVFTIHRFVFWLLHNARMKLSKNKKNTLPIINKYLTKKLARQKGLIITPNKTFFLNIDQLGSGELKSFLNEGKIVVNEFKNSRIIGNTIFYPSPQKKVAIWQISSFLIFFYLFII